MNDSSGTNETNSWLSTITWAIDCFSGVMFHFAKTTILSINLSILSLMNSQAPAKLFAMIFKVSSEEPLRSIWIANRVLVTPAFSGADLIAFMSTVFNSFLSLSSSLTGFGAFFSSSTGAFYSSFGT